jgi:hypothetical protein
MGEADAARQKEFLLNQLENDSGQPLLNSAATTEEKEKIWAAFAAQLLRS